MSILDKASINISDDSGKLRDIDEIVDELTDIWQQTDFDAMSDHALYLKGKENMLREVIAYLERL